MDGISAEVLALIVTDKYRSGSKTNYTLKYMTKILNLWFFSGLSSSYLGKGLMVLIPKPGKSLSTHYKDKRPLTLSNEVPKTCISIIAKRFRNILTDHKILHPANRAYLRGGSVDPCHRLLIGLLEESNVEDKPLCGIFYDQSKAFDRIQWWHVEKMCHRFALPKVFKNFLMSYLKSSTTHIKSAYGLTDEVKLKNSVKQGDPLAGYIYICCMDVLHSHLGTFSAAHGVEIAPNLTISSIGYADDTFILSRCLKSLYVSHQYVVEFFTTHKLRLNSTKTVAFSRCLPQATESKLNFQVNDCNVNFNTETVFRYLGILYTTNLNWEQHLKHVERARIFPIWRRIIIGKFSLKQIRHIYTDLVVSVIDFSSRFFVIPKSFLERWDKLLYRGIVTALGTLYSSLSRDGLYSILGIRTLADCSIAASVSETMLVLNSESTEGKFLRRFYRHNLLPEGTYFPRPCKRNTYETNFNRMLKILKKQNIFLQMNYKSSALGIHKGNMCGSAGTFFTHCKDTKSVDVFTDGSTNHSDTSEISGYAAVIVHNHNLETAQVFQGTIYAKGNNDLAEAAAIICALEKIPHDLNICLYTDALSFINTTESYLSKTHREKMRTSGRAFLRRFHELCTKRKGSVTVKHVLSHSGLPDYLSKGNAVADIECKKARLANLPPDFTPEIGEHIYTLRIDYELVMGDYRKSIKNFQQQKMLVSWKHQKYQGHMARTHPRSLLNKLKQNLNLTPYVVQMATGTIPTGRILEHLPRFHNMEMCPFCDCYVPDTKIHFFNCPATILLLQNTPPPHHVSEKCLLSQQVDLMIASLDSTCLPDSPLSTCQYKALVRIYASRCIIQAERISKETFLFAIESVIPYKHKHTVDHNTIIQLAQCFHSSSLLSGGNPVFWKNCRRWFLMGENIPTILGGWSHRTQLIGASTVIDILVDCSFFKNTLTELFVLAQNTAYPTRIVFQSRQKSLSFEGLNCITTVNNDKVYTYIFQNEQGANGYHIDRSHFLEIFGTQPTFTCDGIFELPDPESEIRLRALLIPFWWVHGFNIIHLFGEFALGDLLEKYRDKKPLNDSICSCILGLTHPVLSNHSTIAMRREWLQNSKWLHNFGKEVFVNRKKMWRSFPR